MRIVHLSLDHPTGAGIGAAAGVRALATALGRAGHDVAVVTPEPAAALAEPPAPGVRRITVAEYPPMVTPDARVAWALHAGIAVFEHAAAMLLGDGADVVHAHGWRAAYAAATLKTTFAVPLVCTLDGTEHGRRGGNCAAGDARLVHQIEWWLAYESRRIIAPTPGAGAELERVFDLPPGKVDVIPEAVEPLDDRARAAGRALRAELGGARARLLLHAGPLEPGPDSAFLLEALSRVAGSGRDVRLVIATPADGAGAVASQARALGLNRRVRFVEARDDARRRALHVAADVLLVPSASETAAAEVRRALGWGMPVVAADGAARHARSPALRTVPAGDAPALADAVLEMVSRRRARRSPAPGPGWDEIARRTAETYEQAIVQERELRRSLREDRPPLRLIFARAEERAGRP